MTIQHKNGTTIISDVINRTLYKCEYQSFTDKECKSLFKSHVLNDLTRQGKDLFEFWEYLPKEVNVLLEKFNSEDNDYTQCESLLKQLKPLGFTFEYELSAEPFNLKKL